MISARHPIAALRTRSGETRRMTHRTTIDDQPRATVSRIWSAAARWCHPRPTRGAAACIAASLRLALFFQIEAPRSNRMPAW